MFLHSNLPGSNPHSDDSISDDEDQEANCPNILDHTTNKQQALPLSARLDLLKGRICNQNQPTEFQPLEDEEVEMPYFFEDDSQDVSVDVVPESEDDKDEKPLKDEQVEMPDFNACDFQDLLGMVVPDSEDDEAEGSTVRSTGFFRRAPQTRDDKVKDTKRKSEALVCFKESTSCSASHATCSKATSYDGNHHEDEDDIDIEFSETDIDTDLDPQDNQRKGNTVQLFKKNRSNLPEIVPDSEDSPEPVGSRSSSDNEKIEQHTKITFPEKKMLTMSDRFHDALRSSNVSSDNVEAINSLRTGICLKLQQVIQKEKVRDMDFSKMILARASPEGEFGCADVKIISRYLDGKLIVCQCSFGKYNEKSLIQDEELCFDGNNGGQRTIIFSPRVCNKVVLEVGSLVRIYAPWKQVQVGDDSIILCSYFSEISSPF
ncbi:uncharacterized protein [Cicer arietinum]|uniref:Uncharacterized protein LOC101489376 isoform X2 n=1 Tax=Cicer arietinum TaxID=3827 RepID=A0A1S3EIF0_CICAR|nr:uncharacterized protein LOC101489376 isoform X2 [Cicer arietinum]